MTDLTHSGGAPPNAPSQSLIRGYPSGILFVGTLAMLTWFGAGGCTTTPSETPAPSSTQQALVGKTKQELLTCAQGRPEEKTVDEITVLKYYKEASLLEESFPGTKSSFARVHHGCWATLRLTRDVVTEVQYRSVPMDYQDDDHCDEIFALCLGQ
ncbi:MAG: hypothetical protein KJS98_18465 [Nitrospirae bacterium]|nr:hypothetical protein [Nitrospirota bacterium]